LVGFKKLDPQGNRDRWLTKTTIELRRGHTGSIPCDITFVAVSNM